MDNTKMRSVGAAPGCPGAWRGKALVGAMVCAAALLGACGQKRPLQLPEAAGAARKPSTATPMTAPAAAAAPASSASAAIMPVR